MEDKYLLLSFKNGCLVFSSTNDLPCPNDVINSNKIYHNMYIYTLKYFKKNNTDILSLMNKVLLKNKIYKVYLEDSRLVELVLKFIKILIIKSIYIKNSKSLSASECSLIAANKNLSNIDAYYIPSNYLNKIKKTGKSVNLSYQNSLSDNFMVEQDAIDNDALYFKRVLHFNKNYEYQEKELKDFLKLNINLKTIHLHYFDKNVLESVVKCVEEDNRKNISILIYGIDENASEYFNYLKELCKSYVNKTDGEIKIIYSKHFIKNNLFRQLTYNNIKFCLFIIIYVLFVGVVFSEFYNYTAKVNMDRLNYEMYVNSTELTDSEGNPAVEEYEEEPTEEEQKVQKSKYELDSEFSYLISKNKDTVGWLTVNNTRVNYPVVQGKDNDYYLNHDFFKSKTSIGWVFMDFRDDPVNLSDNTIIYGHKLKSGLMFGTLPNTLNSSWYKNKSNQLITFNLPNNEMKWQIISMYRTNYTTDYLVVNFRDEEHFNEWINKMVGRSIYNFKIDTKYGDKILTLSTCIGSLSANQRMVIHAKLVK